MKKVPLPLPEFRALMGMMRCPRNLLPSSITATRREASSGIKIWGEFRTGHTGEEWGAKLTPSLVSAAQGQCENMAGAARFGEDRGHTLGHTQRHPHSSCPGRSTQGSRAGHTATVPGVLVQTTVTSLSQVSSGGKRPPGNPMEPCILVWEFIFLPVI